MNKQTIFILLCGLVVAFVIGLFAYINNQIPFLPYEPAQEGMTDEEFEALKQQVKEFDFALLDSTTTPTLSSDEIEMFGYLQLDPMFTTIRTAIASYLTLGTTSAVVEAHAINGEAGASEVYTKCGLQNMDRTVLSQKLVPFMFDPVPAGGYFVRAVFQYDPSALYTMWMYNIGTKEEKKWVMRMFCKTDTVESSRPLFNKIFSPYFNLPTALF
jgi:hypothetical protein